MALFSLLWLASAASALRAAPYLPNDVNEHFTISRLQSQYKPGPLTELKVTDNVINLKRADSWSLSSVYVQGLRRQAAAERANVRILDADLCLKCTIWEPCVSMLCLVLGMNTD